MGRKAKKQANNLAAVALVIGVSAIGIGLYIDYKLRPYRIFQPFTGEQRGWRDEAFQIAVWSCLAAVALFLLAKVARKL